MERSTHFGDELLVIGELRAAVQATVGAPRVRRPFARRRLGAGQVVLERLDRALARRARARRAVAVRVAAACVVVVVIVVVDDDVVIVVRGRGGESTASVTERDSNAPLSVSARGALRLLLLNGRVCCRCVGHRVRALVLLRAQKRQEAAQLSEWSTPGDAFYGVRVLIFGIGRWIDVDRLVNELRLRWRRLLLLLRLKKGLEFGRLFVEIVSGLWREREWIVFEWIRNGERRGGIDDENRLLCKRVRLEICSGNWLNTQ